MDTSWCMSSNKINWTITSLCGERESSFALATCRGVAQRSHTCTNFDDLTLVPTASPYKIILKKPLICSHHSTPYNGHAFWPQMMPINTKRPLTTASSTHNSINRAQPNCELDFFQRFFHEQESMLACDSLKSHKQGSSVRFIVYILQFSAGTQRPLEWAWLIRLLSNGHPCITAKIFGPNGGRFRGVPL